MNKTKVFLAAFTLSLLFGSFTASAACSTCVPVGGLGPDDDIIEFGSFSAKVRWTNPHQGPDGRYYTYSYTTLTGTTMAYCQQQLNAVLANPNVSVVQYCQAD